MNLITWVWEFVKSILPFSNSTEIILNVNKKNKIKNTELEKTIMFHIPKNVLFTMLKLADRDIETIYFKNSYINAEIVKKDVVLKLSNYLSLVLNKYAVNTEIKAIVSESTDNLKLVDKNKATITNYTEIKDTYKLLKGVNNETPNLSAMDNYLRTPLNRLYSQHFYIVKNNNEENLFYKSV